MGELFLIIIHLYHNALALLDLYSQVSLSLNPTPSRLRVRKWKLCFRLLLCMQCSSQEPVCNVLVSGESRETKGWPPTILWQLQASEIHWTVWGGRSCLRTDTAVRLNQQTLRRTPKPLVIRVVPLKVRSLLTAPH